MPHVRMGCVVPCEGAEQRQRDSELVSGVHRRDRLVQCWGRMSQGRTEKVGTETPIERRALHHGAQKAII